MLDDRIHLPWEYQISCDVIMWYVQGVIMYNNVNMYSNNDVK